MSEHPLAEDLVHAQRRRGGVGACKWQVDHLEEALNGAVLAIGAVEDGEGDVNRTIEQAGVESVNALEAHDVVGSIRRFSEHSVRGLLVGPQPAAVDCHRHDLVPCAIECAVDRPRRDDTHLMLGGAPSEHQCHTMSFRHSRFPR